MPTWTVHTDVFEGPLDLLLYLVQRDGIDLHRLAVAQIADAYLDFVQQMRSLNLSVAGDYLVMAATLVHLKSLELLPRLPTEAEEDAPDPREAFAQRLRDYQRYRDAAQFLDDQPRLGRDHFPRPETETGAAELERPFDAFGLLDVYRELLAAKEAPEPEVRFEEEPHYDMGDAVFRLLEIVHDRGGTTELTSILMSIQSKALRVITFIGVLEMLKLGWVKVEQAIHLGSITIKAVVAPGEADRRALSGWVEEPA